MAERLSNQNKLDIQRLVGEGKNSKQIAATLDKSEQTIINYVGKVAHELLRLHENGVKAENAVPVPEEQPPEPPAISELPDMTDKIAPARKKPTAFAQRDGATIMTRAQAERGDSLRKIIPRTSGPTTTTTKPFNDGK